MAIAEIENGNIKQAMTYLNLTINDYSDNEEYVYRAQVLKSLVCLAELDWIITVMQKLDDGKQRSILLSNKEKDLINQWIQQYKSQLGKDLNDYKSSVQYILTHYSDKTKEYLRLEKQRRWHFCLDLSPHFAIR